jgi:hypothetical protein
MATEEKPGNLPGRQTEVANASDGFPAAHDLKRAKDLPQSVRERLREVDGGGTARGLHDAGGLGAPTGDNQESRRRGTHQGE